MIPKGCRIFSKNY